MRTILILFTLFLPFLLDAKDTPQAILNQLPQTIAGCERGKIKDYEDPGLGASAAYNTPWVIITVYVYDQGHPRIAEGITDRFVTQNFAGAKNDIKTALEQGTYSSVKIRSDGRAIHEGGFETLYASYFLTHAEGPLAGRKMLSELHIFGARDQLIKIRISSELANETERNKTLDHFIPAFIKAIFDDKKFDAAQKAAALGDANSQKYLGNAYSNGEGVAKDPVEAVKWWRKAAIQGHAGAQNNLGVAYNNGNGVAKDPVEGVKWTRKAADQGLDQAQFNLGLNYVKGEGVKQDVEEMLKWHYYAAMQGHAGAQESLGSFLAMGKDSVKAYAWLSLAAASNEKAKKELTELEKTMTAQQIADGKKRSIELGALITKGNDLRKAAEQGNAEAQFNLGRAYANGEGVPKDLVEAYAWVNIAAATHEDAKKVRAAFELTLTAQQVAAGQKRSTELSASMKAK